MRATKNEKALRTGSKLYAVLSLGLLLVLPACTRDDSDSEAPRTVALTRVTSLETETLGGFAIGSETSELLRKLGEPETKSIDSEAEAAFGCFFTEWLYPDRGLSFAVCGDQRGEGYVRWITASPPSMARTSGGIGPGSSAADMKIVYGGVQLMDEAAWVLVAAEIEAGIVMAITLSEMPE
jgi:hypothetical protein